MLWEKDEEPEELVTEVLEAEQTVKNFRQIKYQLEFSSGILPLVTGV